MGMASLQCNGTSATPAAPSEAPRLAESPAESQAGRCPLPLVRLPWAIRCCWNMLTVSGLTAGRAPHMAVCSANEPQHGQEAKPRGIPDQRFLVAGDENVRRLDWRVPGSGQLAGGGCPWHLSETWAPLKAAPCATEGSPAPLKAAASEQSAGLSVGAGGGSVAESI